ncbi:hypothetical protein LFAB_08830 [Lactiplantibacillus fabifermentans T30PCM01]|uniref:Uncharacterized protein n=1 Tax=Lactiplantibacillus fabifermentans T30PCM01 TaxID=1400520 RepID=W6T7K6_9LACO|nr:hypothetical protein [Lactiplantibacillus fabifermentans]ETY74134.1 hypothetical protein LFAB_08830 [Lactiplantibacillus fabifermentans T30PCM01]
MKTDQLIAQNNQLQQKLSPANKTYYENLLVFMRSHSLLKNDIVLETSLLEILNDLIEAQQHGISAHDYYGQNPREQAQALLNAIPNDLKGFVRLSILLSLELLGILTLNDLITPSAALDWGRLLLQAAILVGFTFLILWLLGNTAFTISAKRRVLTNWLSFIGVIVAIGLTLLLSFVHTPLSVTPANHLVLIITSILLISGILFLFMKRPTLPFFIIDLYVLGQLLLATATRIPALSPLLNAKFDFGIWTWPIVIVLCVIAGGISSWLVWRHSKQV